jgi:AraC-like DNA-binding protein
MDSVPLVRASGFLPFLDFLTQIGTPIEREFAELMLPGHLLNEPESLVPLNQAFLFLDRTATAEGLVDLGVLAAGKTHLEQLGAFGRLVCRSLTLKEALAKISRMISLFDSAKKIWLEPWGTRVRLCHRYAPSVGVGREYGDQFTIMMLIDCIRLVAGPRWWPAEIHLEAASWRKLEHRLHTFAETPLIMKGVSGIVFDPALLCMPIESARLYRKETAERDYEALKASAPAVDFPDSIQQLVRSFLGEDRFDIDHIASIAGMKARTLQRRLAENGVDFSALVDAARFEVGMKLLEDRTIKLTDLAHELGYSEVASFTRAFRRWTGVAPSKFRRLRADCPVSM